MSKAHSPLQIFYTEDLSIFRFRKTNRDVNMNRVKNIAKSMKEDGFYETCPVTINKKFSLIDGQHRVEASKLAGVGVYYVINDKVGDSDMDIFIAAVKLNKDQKSWDKTNYVKGLADQNVHSYKVLWDFMEKYPMFSMTECIMLLQNSGSNWVKKEDFANGKFVIGSVSIAELWAERILRLKPYFSAYNTSNFVRTMIILFDKKSHVFHFDEFLKKLDLRPTSLKRCGDKRSYSELIEDIYNYKRKTDERVSLRFL